MIYISTTRVLAVQGTYRYFLHCIIWNPENRERIIPLSDRATLSLYTLYRERASIKRENELKEDNEESCEIVSLY